MKKAKRKFHGKTENMGRPPMKAKDRRSKRITVWITCSEWAAIKRAAKGSGLTLGEVLAGPWRPRGGN